MVPAPVARGQAIVAEAGGRAQIILGGPEINPDQPPEADKPGPLPLINVDEEMSGYIRRAGEMIASKDYAGAIEILQALLNRTEQCFISTRDPRRFVSLSVGAGGVIGQLPPEGMKLYRGLYDPRAERLFRSAMDRLDESALRSIIDRYSYTSYGSRALSLLGAVLFDRGEFSQAAHCWRRVIAVNGSKGAAAPPKDEAVLLARITVAHHFAGESKHASKVLDLLIKRHPKIVAAFGGRDENVVEFVRRMFAVSPPLAEVHYKEGWPSLAGAPDSVAVMSPCRPVLSPRWTIPDGRLADNPNIDVRAIRSTLSRRGPRGGIMPKKVLLREGRVIFTQRVGNKNREVVIPAMIHPIVVGKTVLYRAADGVVAIDLLTGETLWGTIEFPLFSGASGVVRAYSTAFGAAVEDRGLWTVTAGDGKVFAVGGCSLQQQRYYNMRNRKRLVDTSALAAFSINNQGRMLWRIGAGEGDSDLIRGGKFLTAPTYLAGRLYVLVEYIQAHHLVCLNAENGRLVWETMVAQTPMLASRFGRRQNLQQDRISPPAVSAGKVFVVTNAGVAAAFEADTGRSLWAYQYVTRQGLSAPPNPIVVTRGRAICLPADCEQLLAFRTDTGQLDWSIDRSGQRDLTAVDGARVLLSGEGIVIIDAVTGRDIWKAEGVSGVHSRPAVTSDAILASGRGEVVRVSLPGFHVRRLPLVEPDAILGNLIGADGKLIAANAAGLSAYFTFEDAHAELTARMAEVPPEEIQDLLYHRAVNAFSAGRPQKALEDLLRVRKIAEDEGNSVLLAKTSQMLYRTYVSLADRRSSSSVVMLDFYNKARAYAYSDRSRGEMQVRLVKYYANIGGGAKSAELAQEITTEYAKVDLADVQIGADADPFVRDNIDTQRFGGYELGHCLIKDLIARHGQRCYGVFDAKASSALAAAVASDEAEAMVRVADTYRHSVHAPMALLRSAESRYRQALHLKGLACRKLLVPAGRDLIRINSDYPDSGLSASAHLGLAMVYRQMNPRVMWLGLRGLEEVQPDTSVSFAGVSGSAGEALRRLASGMGQYQPVPSAFPGPINPPLEQIFRGPESESAIILRDADGRPVRCGDSLFLLAGGRIARFDPAAGTFKEAIQWETIPLIDTKRAFRSSTSFMLRAGLTGDSVVLVVGCWRGGIVGVDVKTGRVLWRRSASDRMVANLHFMVMAEDRFAALTRDGNIFVLDMHTGKELWNYKISPQQRPWRAPPQVAGGTLLVCYGRTTIWQAGVFDIATGKLLGNISLAPNMPQAHLTPDGLVVVCDGKSLRLIEPILGIDQPIWSIELAENLKPAILGVTAAHVLLSPSSSSGVVELRSLSEMGRIMRTFQTKPVGGKTAIPIHAVVAGSRLYVAAGSVVHARGTAVRGKGVCFCMSPSLHAFDLTSSDVLWSADLAINNAGSRYSYLMPVQVGRKHLCTLVKGQNHNDSPVVMIIETDAGKVAQKLTLPNTAAIHRSYRNSRHTLLSSPAITTDRLVAETHKGLEVYGKRQ